VTIHYGHDVAGCVLKDFFSRLGRAGKTSHVNQFDISRPLASLSAAAFANKIGNKTPMFATDW
jgi:hypothetical protein